MTLKERLAQLKVKRDEMQVVFDEAGPEYDFEKVKSIRGDDVKSTEDVALWVQEREKELTELQGELTRHMELEKTRENLGTLGSIMDILDMPANSVAGFVEAQKGSTKSFGEMFAETYEPSLKGREIELEDYDVKALFATTAGWAPETTRTGLVVPFATRPIQVTQLIPFTTTEQAAVVYMEETTYTNAATGVAEAGAYPESTYELTEKSSPVRKIAHFIPVTDEQLEDVQQAQGYLDNRLRFGLEQELDEVLLVGDGVAPNLEGILTRAGINTQAKGADPVPDALYKGYTLASVTGRSMPNAYAIHSTDWQNIRLLRTTDGIYIWGSPSEVGQATMWGLPVAVNQVVAVGQALVGDFANFSEFAMRRGITVKVSDSHADYFTNGKQAIRADMRGALQVYRPSAFTEVTGLNA